MEARDSFCFPKNTKNPNPSPIGKKFGFCCCGAPEGTRTPDLLIRSQTLYPAELPAHILLAFSPENVFYYSAGGGESQAVFQKNSKKSANGHLYRKFAAKRAAFRLFVVAGSATEN